MKRKLILIIAVILALSVIGTALGLFLYRTFGTRPQTTETSDTTAAVQSVPASSAVEATTQAPTEEVTTVPASAEEVQTSEPEQTEAPVTEPVMTQAPHYDPPEPPPVPQTTAPQGVVFPYTIEDTTLVIENINSYDGIFLEDGSDTEIEGVGAIILKNTGDKCVEYAEIVMVGQEKSLRFVVSGLDAGASVVVMEADRESAVPQHYEVVMADVALTDSFEMSENILKVSETEDGQLEVRNLSDLDIPVIRIFYKFYMEQEQLYVGGITYTVKIKDLKAGESAFITPSHYASGSSRILMVKTYETDEE